MVVLDEVGSLYCDRDINHILRSQNRISNHNVDVPRAGLDTDFSIIPHLIDFRTHTLPRYRMAPPITRHVYAKFITHPVRSPARLGPSTSNDLSASGPHASQTRPAAIKTYLNPYTDFALYA